MIVADVLFVLIGTALAWWISGYDSRVTGQEPTEDFTRRAIRCLVTAGLLIVATWNGFAGIFIFLGLGLYWASCGAEFFSHQIHKLIDPEDKRAFDPKETERKLDQLAQLIREGRHAEALDSCEKLESSGEGSALALEATKHRLYQEILNSISTTPLLANVRSLCEQSQLDQAESGLKQILAGQPQNWAAMLLLMRIYAEGMFRPDKALALLTPAETGSATNSPRLPKAFANYARQSIAEWNKAAHGEQTTEHSTVANDIQHGEASPAVVTGISVDELLQNSQFATAIEHLENGIAQEPRNFDLWLKLAEAHGVYCRDLNRAAKIIQKMENSGRFTPQEIELAKAKLKEWRAGRRS